MTADSGLYDCFDFSVVDIIGGGVVVVPDELVLASSSEPRRMLLRRLRLRFKFRAPNIDETPLDGEEIGQLVKRLSYEKANAAAAYYPKALVIGSDQCVCVDGVFIGKPGDYETAKAQLRRVSGRRVIFHTGVCLLAPQKRRKWVDNTVTEVCFRSLQEREIDAYLRKEKPWLCAGSFRNEKLGTALVEYIRSDDPSALTGLPLISLCRMLRAAGVSVP